MLGEINKQLAPYQPSIYLAKPDRTIICKLSEAYNIKIIQNLNGIHEISLEIPYQISKHNKNVRNKHVDLLRGHYLLKVDADWFVISNNQSSSSKESMAIEAKLLPYQLRRKTIFSLAEEKNATEILNICLADTPWSVAYVDADFALQLRKFEVNEKTKLEFLFDIAEAYNGVLKFDTENLTVSLYKLENVGANKGLSISYGKYLKDINKNPNFDDVCTRLYVYGKDSLEINSVNPTGTAYLEDFSYYLHPYSETITDVQNDLYIVNAHSHYLSDELCHAILKYNKALENEKGNFTSLFNELETLNSQLAALQQDLEQLNENLLLAKDELALHNAKNNEDEDQDLIAAVTSAEEDYNARLSEVEVKKAAINTVNGNIESLRTSIELANPFTPEQLQERDLFIFERKWTNDSYSDANELYQRGITELKKASQPQIAYSLDIVDFLKVVECQHDWDKLAIGDIVTVKYEKFKIDIKAKIIKITRNIDANKLSIEIANTTDINRGFYEWVDLLKKSVSTSAVLNTNKYKWDEGYTANSKIENYINNKIDAAKQAIVAGVNQSVNIDRQGIKISDPADHDNFIKILHNVLAFTNDGGNTFKHAITSNGIVGDYIYGKLIAGVNLTIESTDSQSFRVDENGVTIAGSALTITNGLPVDQLASGVILEGSPYNGVVIDSTDGIVITRSDSKVKATLNATDGFKLQSSADGVNWVDKLYAGIDGNLIVHDLVAKNIVLEGGSITWGEGGFEAPTYSQILEVVGDEKPPVNADNTAGFMESKGFIGLVDGQLFINADSIKAGTLSASIIDVDNLYPKRIHAYNSALDQNVYADFVYNLSSGTSDFTVRNDNKEIFRVIDQHSLVGMVLNDQIILVTSGDDSVSTWTKFDFNNDVAFKNVRVSFDNCVIEGLSSVAVFG